MALACSGGTTSSTKGGSGGQTAGNNGDKAAAGVQTAPIGQPLTLKEKIFTTTTSATITASNARVLPAPNEFEKADKGQFYAVDVSVSVSEGKFSISSGSFKLVAADGTAYDSTFMSGVQQLSANDLTPGQKTSGTVVFDAAKGAESGGKLALKNIMAEGDAGYWTLS
jgi:hypothetical protein